MEYFYNIAENLFTTRVKEIQGEKAKGKKVVGVLCNFVPEELVLASGAIPIRLAFGFSDTILTAEEYLPRNFCPLLKSSFGSYLESNPLFDLCDVIVIPTSCDGKKKMGEMLAEFKPVWVLEVPHCTNTTQGRDLWLKEIKLLSNKLSKLTGQRTSRRKIRKATTVVNRKRALVHRLYEARRGNPAIWGRDALFVTFISYFDNTERWNEKTGLLCSEIEHKNSFARPETPRIMITGSPIVAPSWKIPVIVEESGGVVVTDDLCTGTKGYWDPVEKNIFTTDQLISIADRYLMNTCACFTPNTARVVRLKQFSEDWKIDGIIYHVSQACHTYGMEQRAVNREFDAIDIPVLNIETDFSQEDVEQIRTRIEAFMELIVTKKRRALLGGNVVMPTTLSPMKVAALPPAASLQRQPLSNGFSFNQDFPLHEQPLGNTYEPKAGEKLQKDKLKPPG